MAHIKKQIFGLAFFGTFIVRILDTTFRRVTNKRVSGLRMERPNCWSRGEDE